MIEKRNISIQEATQIGNALGVNWNQIDIAQFRRGLEVELEHGLVDKTTNVTNDDMLMTGKIALAHLSELSDYYTRLDMMESAQFDTLRNSISSSNNNNTLKFVAGAAVGAGLLLFMNYLKDKKDEKC